MTFSNDPWNIIKQMVERISELESRVLDLERKIEEHDASHFGPL